MGYTAALEAAGATVHDMTTYGSYQGEWIAHVTLPDGRSGLIKGWYGSCSGCDAFEAEFSHDIHDYQRTHEAEFDPTCELCVENQQKLKKFGEQYFSELRTPSQLFVLEFESKTYWSRYDEDVAQLEYIMSFLERDEWEDEVVLARLQVVLAYARNATS